MCQPQSSSLHPLEGIAPPFLNSKTPPSPPPPSLQPSNSPLPVIQRLRVGLGVRDCAKCCSRYFTTPHLFRQPCGCHLHPLTLSLIHGEVLLFSSFPWPSRSVFSCTVYFKRSLTAPSPELAAFPAQLCLPLSQQELPLILHQDGQSLSQVPGELESTKSMQEKSFQSPVKRKSTSASAIDLALNTFDSTNGSLA